MAMTGFHNLRLAGLAISKRQLRTSYAWLPTLMLVMTVGALVLGGTALHYVNAILVANEGETLALAAADIADKLDLLLTERYGNIQILAQAKVFRERDVAAMTAHLHALREAYPVYAWLGVTNAQGRIIAATDPASVGKDRSGREWFGAVRNRDAVHVGDAQPSDDSGGVMAVSFTAPIRSPGGAFWGAVTTRMSLPILEDVFAQTVRMLQARYGAGAQIEYQFLQRDGTVIADSRLREEERTNLKLMGLPSALATDSAQPGYIEEKHLRRQVPVVTGYAQTERSGNYYGLRWGVLVRMDREDILVPTRKVLWKVGAAGTLVLVPMFSFLFWSTGQLRKEWALTQKEAARATVAETDLRKANAELSRTLQEIKVLRGFIPICMTCKKIRDDKGFWQQLETYIQKHSEALFSHGVCPDCYQELSDKYLKD